MFKPSQHKRILGLASLALIAGISAIPLSAQASQAAPTNDRLPGAVSTSDPISLPMKAQAAADTDIPQPGAMSTEDPI